MNTDSKNNLGHIIWTSFSHSYHIRKVGVIKVPLVAGVAGNLPT